MSVVGTIVVLFAAFLGALLVAPFVDRRGKAPEVRLTRWVAIAYVVLAGGATIYRLLEIALSPSLKIDMPVGDFWPRLPASAGVEGPTAQVVSGGFTQALVEVQGLAAGTRWLIASGELLQGVAAVFIGAAVISMCNGYLKRTSFRPVLVKWFSTAAVVIMVCGMAWQVLEGIAGIQASEQVLGVVSAHWDRADLGRENLNEIIGQLEPRDFALEVNFWPLWAGLGLFTTAQIFKRGLEMQKDTAGLI
ncbi:MAG: hypothetical protein ABWX63_05610 [Paeniglutamicibacter terrestris]